MKLFLKKVLCLLDARDRRKFTLLFLFIFGGTLLEFVGIGAIMPLIILLSRPNIVQENDYMRMLYEWVAPSSFNEFSLWVGISVVAVFLFKNIYLSLLIHVQNRMVYSKHVAMSSHLFLSYLYSPYIFHLQQNSSRLLHNITGASLNVTMGVFLPVVTLAAEFFVVCTLAIFVIIYEPVLSSLVIIFLGTLLGIFYLFVRRRLRYLGKQLHIRSSLLFQVVNQGLGSIKETKILGREKFFETSYLKHARQAAKSHAYQSTMQRLPSFYIETMVVILIVFVLLYNLYAGIEPHIILTTISMFGLVAIRLMPSMNRISAALNLIQSHTPFLDEVCGDTHTLAQKLDRSRQENHEVPHTSTLPTQEFKQIITLKDLVYVYADASEPALKNISLSFKKRESVGFVGPSGSGKTTIINVLLGLLEPTQGQVLVDGQDIQNDLPAWQRQIGYIPQNIYITDDSIRKNIAFGLFDQEIEEEKVWDALRLAQLETFVKNLPDGLDTVVGENGIRISGGQQQRIGIARALYHDPALLVMDEATASLDNETERSFMAAVGLLSGKKTVILIAHRLTTVQHCDTIFFLAGGRLLIEGTYHDLLAKSSEFRKMAGVTEVDTPID